MPVNNKIVPFMLAAIASCSIPFSLIAQEKDGGEKEKVKDLIICRRGENGVLVTEDVLGNGLPVNLSYESENGFITIDSTGAWEAVKTGEDYILMIPDYDLEEMKALGMSEHLIPDLPEEELVGRVHVFITDDYPVYSLKNPKTGQYFITENRSEWKALLSDGWQRTSEQFAVPEKSEQPVTRLLNPNNGDHLYTRDLREISYLLNIGWKEEPTQISSDPQKGIPVYRFYGENDGVGSHFYTTNPDCNWGPTAEGWINEGIAFYSLETPLKYDSVPL